MTFDPGQLTPITATWVLLSALALLFSALNLREGYKDRGYAQALVNGRKRARMEVANGSIFRNWVRVVTFAWWVKVGFIWGFFEPPQIIGLAGTLGLVATVGGHVIMGFREGSERRALNDILAYESENEMRALDALNQELALASTERQRAALLVARTAADAAQKVADAARQKAEEIATRTAEATEKTAKATERIADAAETNGS